MMQRDQCWINQRANRLASISREIVLGLTGPQRDRSALARRILMEVLLRPFTPSVAVERDGIRYYVSTSDRVVGGHTFASGGFELDLMLRAVKLIEELKGPLTSAWAHLHRRRSEHRNIDHPGDHAARRGGRACH